MSPVLAAALAWYVGMFGMSLLYGINRYRLRWRFDKVRITTIMVCLSILWPVISFGILVGIPAAAFCMGLYVAVCEMNGLLAKVLDGAVIRKRR